MADVTYEDYQDLVRKLSLANERVRDLQERVSIREARIAALEAQLAEAKRFLEMALDYEGDVFGRHHNDVIDLLLPAAPATSKGGADLYTRPSPAPEEQQEAVVVSVADINTWRAEWLDANDPQDGTDCVTPFDKYLYTRPER